MNAFQRWIKGRRTLPRSNLRLPALRAVRAALHRHDLPDELPQEPAQWPLRRRAPERALRGEARDALCLGGGVRNLAVHAHLRARTERHPAAVDRRLQDSSAWINMLTGSTRRCRRDGSRLKKSNSRFR